MLVGCFGEFFEKAVETITVTGVWLGHYLTTHVAYPKFNLTPTIDPRAIVRTLKCIFRLLIQDQAFHKHRYNLKTCTMHDEA